MTFEEEFPSLKGLYEKYSNEYLFSKEEVQKHTIDKQRVREAIEKAHYEASCFEGGQIIQEVDYVFNNLKKRLGLCLLK